MHLPPGLRGAPPLGGRGQPPTPLPVAAPTVPPATGTRPQPASSPTAAPSVACASRYGEQQHQHQHHQQPPSRPQREAVVQTHSVRPLDALQQQQQQQQRSSLAAELTRVEPAAAERLPFERAAAAGEAEGTDRAVGGAIVAPLRVRRRGPRPQASNPPPPLPQRAAVADGPAAAVAATATAASASAAAARSPRPPSPRQQQQQQQNKQQQNKHQPRPTPRSRASMLAALAVAVGAIAALTSAAYAPPPAFAAPTSFAGGGGGGASGLAAAAAAATAAPQWFRAAVAAAAAGGRRTRAPRAAAAATATAEGPPPSLLPPPVRLLAVVGAGARSPYAFSAPTAASLAAGQGDAPPPPPLWRDVAPHLAERLALSNPRFRLEVLREEEVLAALAKGGGEAAAAAAAEEVLARALRGGGGGGGARGGADGPAPSSSAAALPPVVAIVAMGLTDARTADLLASPTGPASDVGTLLALPTDAERHGIGGSGGGGGGGGALEGPFARLERSGERVGGYEPSRAGPLSRLLAAKVPFSPQARAAKLLREAREMLSRRTSDDALFSMLTVIHSYGGVSVPDVANAAQGGVDLALLTCIAQHCREPVLACVSDPTCKAGLDCLSAVPPNDQVASYRCIVAHETPLFSRFSLCVLQLHNCRGLTAEMPAAPDPPPMASFRGLPLTHAAAEGILYGHGVPADAPAGSAAASARLVPGTRGWAWRIAGGKNAAFDRFPAQHQLFYRTGSAPVGSPGGAIWYVPVFAVSPDGGVLKEKVWRDRRYRVRLGKQPGSFVFTVSDNGVTSREEWTLLDAEDGLDWSLFYYRGAASAAGMSYSGAVLATRDGEWPEGAANAERVERALAAAGIEPWELTRVDNSDAAVEGAPLPARGGWPMAGAAAA